MHSEETRRKIADGVRRAAQDGRVRRGYRHDESTKKKIAAGMALAHKEGRAKAGSPFRPGDARLYVHEKGVCQCSFCRPTKEQRRERAVKASSRRSREDFSQMGKRGARYRIEWEQVESEKLVASGYDVFMPHAVCDRVAVKDGRVYFVEFKQHGQVLRPAQQRVADVAGSSYLTVYSELHGDRSLRR